MQTTGIMTITLTSPVSGERESRSIDLSELGPAHDRMTRKTAGIPLSTYLSDPDKLGMDGLLLLWWVAGVMAGINERYDTVLKMWPSYQAIGNANPEVEVDNGEEDESDPNP